MKCGPGQCDMCGSGCSESVEAENLSKSTLVAVRLIGKSSVFMCRKCFIKEYGRKGSKELARLLWDSLVEAAAINSSLTETQDEATSIREDAERMYAELDYLRNRAPKDSEESAK